MVSRPKTKVEEVAECLLARYRNEEWFIASRVLDDEPTLVVTEDCPFEKHRPIMDKNVRVTVGFPEKPKLVVVDTKKQEREERRAVAAVRTELKLRDKRAFTTRAARAFKKKIIRVCVQFVEDYFGPCDSAGQCYLVSAALMAHLLKTENIQTKMIEYDFGFTNHFVLQLENGHIIDGTADQFNGRDGYQMAKTMPRVYVGAVPVQYARWIARARKSA